MDFQEVGYIWNKWHGMPPVILSIVLLCTIRQNTSLFLSLFIPSTNLRYLLYTKEMKWGEIKWRIGWGSVESELDFKTAELGPVFFPTKPRLLNGLCLHLHSHWKQGREVYSRARGREVHLPSECWVSELMTFYKWGWNQIQCQTSSQQWSQHDTWQVDYNQVVWSLVTVITLLIQFFGSHKISIYTFFSF